MDKILLERKNIYEYIKDMLISCKTSFSFIDDKQYHHNSCYEVVPSICQYGILSLSDLNKMGIVRYSDDMLKILGDIDSHINGVDYVSLAKVGLTDLYADEWEYNPYSPEFVDFIVSSKIKAFRSSTHYGNEFLHRGSISNDMIRSIDIRMFELIAQESTNLSDKSVDAVLNRYNMLSEIALAIEKNNLDICFREMSNKDSFCMDIDKVKQIPKLVLKK